MKIADGTYQTKAGSTVTVNGGRYAVEFDWFEENDACFDCVADPYPTRDGVRLFLHWGCDECGGGSAELTKVGAEHAEEVA
jgi:hypothetical protein